MLDKEQTTNLQKFLLVLAVVVGYCLYAIHSLGIKNGLSVTALTWAFFVYCTPVADAGFLVAFPIRLITGIKILQTQIAVWFVAAGMVTLAFMTNVHVFDKTPLLQLFHKIIVDPWPLGLIVVLSFIGTYVNVLFDDDILDVAGARHKSSKLKSKRAKIYTMIGFFAATFALYALLLHVTHTKIKIF